MQDTDATFTLAVGAINPADDTTDAGYKARLFNLGFLWDPSVSSFSVSRRARSERTSSRAASCAPSWASSRSASAFTPSTATSTRPTGAAATTSPSIRTSRTQESPAQNVQAFRGFRKALNAGGALVISEFVARDDRSGPPHALLFHSQMLLASKEGASWRVADYRKWLAEAGFTQVVFEPTPGPSTLIFATA
jgi:hypothetical protein